MVNVIPGHLVFTSCSSGCSNGENKLLLKCFPQQSQHFFALFVVWKICCSGNTIITLSGIWMLFLEVIDIINKLQYYTLISVPPDI